MPTDGATTGRTNIWLVVAKDECGLTLISNEPVQVWRPNLSSSTLLSTLEIGDWAQFELDLTPGKSRVASLEILKDQGFPDTQIDKDGRIEIKCRAMQALRYSDRRLRTAPCWVWSPEIGYIYDAEREMTELNDYSVGVMYNVKVTVMDITRKLSHISSCFRLVEVGEEAAGNSDPPWLQQLAPIPAEVVQKIPSFDARRCLQGVACYKPPMDALEGLKPKRRKSYVWTPNYGIFPFAASPDPWIIQGDDVMFWLEDINRPPKPKPARKPELEISVIRARNSQSDREDEEEDGEGSAGEEADRQSVATSVQTVQPEPVKREKNPNPVFEVKKCIPLNAKANVEKEQCLQSAAMITTEIVVPKAEDKFVHHTYYGAIWIKKLCEQLEALELDLEWIVENAWPVRIRAIFNEAAIDQRVRNTDTVYWHLHRVESVRDYLPRAPKTTRPLFLTDEAMPLRFLRTFLNQEKTIREIADSRPVRLAARATVRAWILGRHKLETSETTKRFKIFKNTVNEEYTRALKKGDEK
ncbi:unnamed protein product, partial [Mesorhabditis spiculigera]